MEEMEVGVEGVDRKERSRKEDSGREEDRERERERAFSPPTLK